jgi:hypothetical protein
VPLHQNVVTTDRRREKKTARFSSPFSLCTRVAVDVPLTRLVVSNHHRIAFLMQRRSSFTMINNLVVVVSLSPDLLSHLLLLLRRSFVCRFAFI